MLIHADCIQAMREMPENSVDSVVCDPPYDLVGNSRNGSSQPGDFTTPYGRSGPSKKRSGFMGKEWDGTGIAFDSNTWAEALRVLKPGGHLLAFGGTRTYHRLACAIEDAGFEIKDTIQWIYGSGFPKSLNVQKAFEKLGEHEAAERFAGYGTATKPAHEPIVMARKPLSESSVARNVLKHGTGAINVDASRVASAGRGDPNWRKPSVDNTAIGYHGNGSRDVRPETLAQGRWPANLLLSHVSGPDGCRKVGTKRVRGSKPSGEYGTHKQNGENKVYGKGLHSATPNQPPHADPDGYETTDAYECVDSCPIRIMDEQSGVRKSNSGKPFKRNSDKFQHAYNAFRGRSVEDGYYGDQGGASRFFKTFEPDTGPGFRYVAKASRAERGEGNSHPCVKPLALMRYLIRMVTPPGGTVLDPFCGSSSTGVAAAELGYEFIGIEQDSSYCAIAEKRISHALEQTEEKLFL